ncbi:hypothetical protein DC522_32615 [Microvirga sp. KLBC 81]|uniref:transcriptional coactivator p15/PC4 family protein n=1 Tax=Microvirga sp. KLBC 81 TaxID=1862707 RepID=UPI000D51DF3A|nr:transcriptional coactivator p15/PC4 family protein [Microvirga sp. KLBC 81]PVE20395.1 hypothetical protein DC522_32615 [Microvirga sp. KLBC 81]
MTVRVSIFTIIKNTQEQVRVGLTDYRGHQLIDLRIYDAQGFPTKSAISLQVSHLPALREAIDAAIIKASELGILVEDLVPTELRQAGNGRGGNHGISS